MGRIIAIANQKGGVGKTTTAVNLAASLAVAEQPTLLVDIDQQANATSGCRDIAPPPARTMDDLLADDAPDTGGAILATALEFLHLLPSSRDLAAGDYALFASKDRERRLARVLAPVRDRFAFVLVDCPPSPGMLTVNALAAADSVLIPLECEYLALEGLAGILDMIERVRRTLNARLRVEGILLTKHDARVNLSNQVEADVRGHFGPLVCRAVVSRSVRLAEAPSHGRPIILYDARSRGAQQYLALARELMEGRTASTSTSASTIASTTTSTTTSTLKGKK